MFERRAAAEAAAAATAAFSLRTNLNGRLRNQTVSTRPARVIRRAPNGSLTNLSYIIMVVMVYLNPLEI